MSLVLAAIACNRFGYGAQPGELRAVSGDPRGWLLEQVAGEPHIPTELASTPAQGRRWLDYVEVRNRPDGSQDPEAVRNLLMTTSGPRRRTDTFLRTHAAVQSDKPFEERWVHFWSNHFTAAATRAVMVNIAGGYEHETIRPHIYGSFTDMLLAVSQSVGMLTYLDNIVSAGPNSPIARTGAYGLNENLGREILELHTLGVEGGYTQRDVRALAMLISGWGVGTPTDARPGEFRVLADAQEPGEIELLGKTYEQTIGSPAAGEEALRDLARHPSTVEFVSFKLAQHFVSDDPPRSAVEQLKAVFVETGGDLRRLAQAVVGLDEAWDRENVKIRPPNDFVIAAFRATGAEDEIRDDYTSIAFDALTSLNQPAFRQPGPDGWKDTADAWIAPEATVRRISWAHEFAYRMASPPDPRALAEQTIGPLASVSSLSEIARAADRAEGIALLLVSPEFQRR
ncbi:DUF1800 domain-containing protein [Parasphingopyxis sp.]|uniref:DUF1800 domain-containing protein n=1 Tax=Parasphingopyxis sp. TaxID=1920299 RepID=UPI00262E1140|nr:DUF1800 domain-containing protein [Parasphingopyxis sp.]